MTVVTRSARSDAESAKVKRLRRSADVTAGSYHYEGGRLVTGWHHHDEHQLEYAVGGVIEVETATAHYLLPPQQAVWIPAGLRHQTTMYSDVESIAVLFDPSLVPYADTCAAVIDVSPLVREMIVHAQRWPIGRLTTDRRAESFFITLQYLVLEAIEVGEPMLSLPTSSDPVVSAAMRFTKANLASATMEDVARCVAVSERTLRRRFRQVTGMSWRTYLNHARMLRAMGLLASSAQSVQEVAWAVGFENVSSFTRAFSEFGGRTPSAFRQRSALG